MKVNVRMRMLLLSGAAIALTGCYNNPQVSLKKPGEGPANYMSKPAVGPGTVAGGSTAGPQPEAKPHHGNVEPQPGGAVHDPHGPAHAGAAEPVQKEGADTPRSGAAVTGNEEGGDRRGPAPKH